MDKNTNVTLSNSGVRRDDADSKKVRLWMDNMYDNTAPRR